MINKPIKKLILTNGYFSLLTDNLGGAPGVNLTIQAVFGILVRVACWASTAALFVIIGALVIYGLLYLKSQGNPQTLGEAKRAFTWGLVGALVIFGVYTIIISVAAAVGVPVNLSQFYTCS